MVHPQQREPDSMQPEQIQAQIESQIPDSQVQVGIEGSHISLIVVSPAFEGLSSVKRQQTVYATLADRIADGSIHRSEEHTSELQSRALHDALPISRNNESRILCNPSKFKPRLKVRYPTARCKWVLRGVTSV